MGVRIDPQTYAELLRRQMAASKPKRRDLEGPVQAAIVQYLDLALDPAETFWSATLNGVRVPVSIRKKLKGQGLRPGLFDIVVIPIANHPRIGVTHLMEVKAESPMSKEQRALMAVLAPLGLGALVRSVDDVHAYLTAQSFNLKAHP